MFHETDAGKTLTRGLAGLVPLVQIAGIPGGGANAETLRPGDVIRMEVEVLRARSSIFKFKGVAKVGDKVAAEVEFAAMVVETGPKA